MIDQQKNADLLRYIRLQLEEQKRSISLYYAELKLKLPTHVKQMTIQKLRDAGGDIDQSTSQLKLPRQAENILKQHADSMRKKDELLDKMGVIHNAHLKQIIEYYKNFKRNLPEDLMRKTMGELGDSDLTILGLERADPVGLKPVTVAHNMRHKRF